MPEMTMKTMELLKNSAAQQTDIAPAAFVSEYQTLGRNGYAMCSLVVQAFHSPVQIIVVVANRLRLSNSLSRYLISFHLSFA